MLGKSSVDIAHLIECAVEIDLSVFSSSNPFVCYKRLLRFEKASTNLRSLQEEIKHDFKKGANRTKRLRQNSAMMVNKTHRPNTTPSARSIGTFASFFFFFLVFRPFCRFTLVYEGHFVLCYWEKTRAVKSC